MVQAKRSRKHPVQHQEHRLLVDASALIALFDSADQYHHQAITFRDVFILRYSIKLFTTNYIYSEAMSHLTHLRIEALQRLDALIRTPPARDPLKMKQLWVKDTTIKKAIPIYFKYLEQDFSITDCTSFILMQEHDIPAAFTFDDNYKIYKYRRGHERSRRGFWKLPEMLQAYMVGPTSYVIVR